MTSRHEICRVTGLVVTGIGTEGHVVTIDTVEASELGGVLIASHADPDFVLLLPRIRGAIFETGGVACHAAIVAREWGLPCVVGARGAMNAADRSSWVQFDAATGEVSFFE